MGTLYMWHHLAKLEDEETRTHRRSFLKLSISSFLSFFVLVLIPGQNCITYVIYSKGKSFKQKEKKYTILVLMGYMGAICHDLALLEHEDKGHTGEAFLN